MEEKKIIINSSQQLAEARAENLKNVEAATLRPHGKMWGMDVFSWYNPSNDDLLTLFQSFPAPITWIGNKSMIESVFAEASDSIVNLKVVCAYNQVDLKLENANYLDAVHGTEDVKSAFDIVKVRKQGNGIILFTASGNEWATQRNDFEYYLKIEQA